MRKYTSSGILRGDGDSGMEGLRIVAGWFLTAFAAVLLIFSAAVLFGMHYRVSGTVMLVGASAMLLFAFKKASS